MALLEPALLLICILLFGLAIWRLWWPASPATQLTADGPEPWLDEPTERQRDWSAPLMRWLNIPIDPWLFVAGMSLLGLLAYFSFHSIFPERPALAAAGSFGIVVLVSLYLGDFFGRRDRRVEAGILDAMDLINAALAGGMPPRQALLAAADAAEPDVGRELREIVDRLDLGFPIEAAVSRLARRPQSESARLFAQALVAKWHSGSDFSELLRSVGELVRDRLKLRLQIESQLSGARYAALFSGLLPYLLIPMFLWRQPDWFHSLTGHPDGPTLLVGAILGQLSGFIWLRRVLRVRL